MRDLSHALVVLTRPWQWPKNLLVLAVPLAAGEIANLQIIVKSVLALMAMMLLSMATYCGNDVLDVANDRQHPTKKNRPVASGRITIGTAVFFGLHLATAGLVLSAVVSSTLLLVGVCYLLIQVAYSLGVKHLPLGDIACIALSFVLRALAGGAATDLPISNSFVLVVGATAFFVASAKRGSEIDQISAIGTTRKVLLNYSPEYLRLLWSSSMTISIVAYLIWSREIQEQQVLAQVTVAPYALALLRYAAHVIVGNAEEPEKVVREDRTLLLFVVLWSAIFLVRAALL